MWEAEPRLYWRVKIDGKWTWRPAVFEHIVHDTYYVKPPEVGA